MRIVFKLVLASVLVAIVTSDCLAVAIPTSFGLGADVGLTNDDPEIDPITGLPNTTNQLFADAANGLGGVAGVRMQIGSLGDGHIIRHRVTVLRFDLSGVEGDLSGAYLELHSVNQGRGTDIFVLNDTAEFSVENWDEATITYNTAPGFLPLDPLPTSYVAFDPAQVTLIGTWGIPAGTGIAATNIAASRPEPSEGPEPGRVYANTIAPEFSLNLSAAIAADTNKLLTLFLTRNGASDSAYTGNNGNVELLTKEGLAADLIAETPVGYSIAPTLILPHATSLDPGGLPGDFDDDGDVDGRDFLAWQRDPSIGNLVDWQTNYGTPELHATVVSVPEPGAWVMLAGLSLLGIGKRGSV